MAAGSGNYFSIDYYWRGSNNVSMIVNPARTQQFGTGITDLSALLAFIKTTFYLDDVIGFKANVGGVDYHGFWGTVIGGGANEKMHRQNRWLEIYADKSTTERRHTFNDAGLNTLAFCEWYNNLFPKTNFANYILSPFKGRSAFFNATIGHGFEHRKVGVTDWIAQDFGGRPTKDDWHEDLGVTPEDIYVKGDFIDIRPFIRNEEGYFLGSSKRIQLLAKINSYLIIYRGGAACGENIGPVQIWTDSETYASIILFSSSESVITGLFLFKDQANTIPLDEGWYAYIDSDNINKVYFVSSAGEVKMTYICAVEPDIYLRISYFFDPIGVYTPGVSLYIILSQDVIVSGEIGIYDGPFLVTSYEYSITVIAGDSSARGDNYNVDRNLSFRILSATASPANVDGKQLNPVQISNF